MSEHNNKQVDLTQVKDLSEIVNQLDTKSDAEIKQELETLELERKRLELELMRDQVTASRARKNAQLENARTRQIAIKQYLAQRDAQQTMCNHRKGGDGKSFLNGQGSDDHYAVIKHRKPNGTYMVLCQRCQKEWHAADRISGEPETPGYQQAIAFPTDNTSSGSSVFTFDRAV